MLDRGKPLTKKVEFWITAQVQKENGPDAESLACKLADALTWVEGVGGVEVKLIDENISNDA